MLALLAAAACIWWLVVMAWGLLATYLAYAHYARRSGSTVAKHCAAVGDIQQRRDELPAVTMLVPLCGVDANLMENLASCLQLDYPTDRLQVIFCVASADDGAVEVARQAIGQHPDRDARLLIGQHVVGVNPKINNIIRAYSQAKHDLLWVCDSNVHLDRHTLLHAASPFLDPGVGLVHHTPEGVNARSAGAAMEQLFLNTAHAKIYLVINWVAVDSCVVGKSTLFRRSDLERLGGLAQFGQYLAEDNMLGIAILQLGLRHVLSVKTARQPLLDMPVSQYVQRRRRWTQIRTFSMPFVTVIEPFTESIVCGLVGAAGFSHFWGGAKVFFCYHMAAWFLMDLVLLLYLSSAPPFVSAAQFCRHTVHWSLRELSAVPIFLAALLSTSPSTVTWRGRTYRLHFGGTVDLVADDGRVSPSSRQHQDIPWSERLRLYIFARPRSPDTAAQTPVHHASQRSCPTAGHYRDTVGEWEMVERRFAPAPMAVR